jgi:membrane protease YdiL (CAAX protease family)
MDDTMTAPLVEHTQRTSRPLAVDVRRVALFLLFAFGIAWAVSLYIYLRGGLGGDGQTVGGISPTFLLLALGVMPAPALAHLLTRWLTREGWQDLKLRPRLRQGWPYWLVAWFGTPLLIMIGAALYFLLFPQHFDPSLAALQQVLDNAAAQTGEEIPIPLVVLFAVQVVQGILIAPLINAPFILGEEFGWRAYLQPKLLPLGWRPTMILMGVIWGLWHWPIILMGYNYGSDYPGAPWAGPLAMVWFAFVVGVFFGWLSLKGKSVWPAVIGHGSMNGVAPAVAFLSQGEPNMLLGPLAVGFIGSLAFSVVALVLLLREPPGVATEVQPRG